MKIFFRNVYYRAASTIITTATKGGTYPDNTFTGWTQMVGTIATAKLPNSGDGEEPSDGGATNYTSGMQIPVELTVQEFSAANYATLKNALHNVKVDIMAFDPDQPTIAYVAHGVRMVVELETESGAEPKLVIKGTRKYGADITSSPYQLVTVS